MEATPVDAVVHLGHHTGVHTHVHGKEAGVLVHHRCSEVEEEEGGRPSVGGNYPLQHAHLRLCIAAGIPCYHVHLHTPVQTWLSFSRGQALLWADAHRFAHYAHAALPDLVHELRDTTHTHDIPCMI